ncbi:EpsG family protein [Fusobacterium hominis]|uniref:EpsG family protein n=2 Tax=Fusobacterium hominis TaxID=2764326 RepID=A0A7G9GVE9_9FUSO|nr:EpsG family protein [Fusobacterium hominis]QNM14781.1 EpsG family protein [Fusobacterium hominis]
MGFYSVDWVYFIFPIFCIIFLFSKNRLIYIILSIYLVIFIGLSKIGADYNGYLMHFNMHRSRIALKYIHGEIFFKLLMRFFAENNFSYDVFRMIYLSLAMILLCIFLYKLSKNYILTLYIIYNGYIIYLCSAYRQMFSMILFFISLYYLKNRKFKRACILNCIGVGFHISSILALLLVFMSNKIKKININRKKIVYLLFICLGLRFCMSYSLSLFTKIFFLMGRSEQFESYTSMSELLPFGLITRLIPFTVVILFFKGQSKFENKLFFMYIISILLYVLFPYDLMMGRLTNNGRILECLLFPIIIFEQKQKFNKIYIIIFVIIYFILAFINQMLKQRGFYPYLNYIFI